MRDKSRDLFDFGSILEHKIFTKDELIEIFSKIKSDLKSIDEIIHFIEAKKEPLDDEAVYLSENQRVDLGFSEIKMKILEFLSQKE